MASSVPVSSTAGDHPLRLGDPEALPYLARQTRLTFARCGLVDPLSADDYVAHGGYAGLARALELDGTGIVDEIKLSGLRGRGGAGFPTGIKWSTVLLAEADQKYVVCNADEGDSGTFADRMLMEGDPFSLIEGMTIAGLAVGATTGLHLHPVRISARLPDHEPSYRGGDRGRVPRSVDPGSGRAFAIETRVGAGAYICGEETSLLDSLEGKRGMVRAKPPLPAIKGLFGKPTVVNNVLSLATVPWIMANGAKAYAEFGMGRSRGTLPFQLAGNVKRGGLIETAFGLTLRDVVEDFGGGTRSGGRCAPCRSADRSAPIFPNACSTRRSTTKPSRP